MLGGGEGLPPLRDWALSPDAALHLVRLVRFHRPALVVELGSGSSTLLVARILRELGSGTVLSVEHDAHHAAATKDLLARSGVDDCARVAVRPLVPTEVDGHRSSWYDVGPDPVAGRDRHPPRRWAAGRPGHARAPSRREPVRCVARGGLIVLDDAKRADETALVERWSSELISSD